MARLDPLAYERAKQNIIGVNRQRQGIGTLAEKTVHAVMKNAYEPDVDKQEIPLCGYVADIFTGEEIVEIQTRSFNTLRAKLTAFLQEYPVTVVLPMPCQKWVSWIDEETGEISKRHKSPVKGNPYLAFPELYKIKSFLTEKNLRIHIALADMEEYRLLNGWSRDKKRGSSRYDRIPGAFVEEICLDRVEDYRQLIPYELEGQFTVKDFAKAAHIRAPLAQTVVHVLAYLGLLVHVGKQGRAYLYEVPED